jgi:hypothetical protein
MTDSCPGRGEWQAIALALETAADLVILDDQQGRRPAHTRGLAITMCLCFLLLCCRCCQALVNGFFLHRIGVLGHMALIGLAAACSVGTHRLQRPSLRAGANTRHPLLYASSDKSEKSCRRRPHL